MGTNNAINLNAAGVVSYDGVSAFTGSPLTSNNALVAGASNNIVNVAPSATSGVPLCSNGVASNPSFQTASIAGGGTNATTFAATNGIVTYNGTSLVNYSGTLIDSSGRYTNTNQTKFGCYNNSTISNVTGDGTAYTIIFPDLYAGNVGSGYSVSTGIFTAPITGNYVFNTYLNLIGVTALDTSCTVSISYNSGATIYQLYDANIGAIQVSGSISMGGGMLLPMTATDTVALVLTVSGSTKTVSIQGGLTSIFSGALLF